MPPNDHTVDLLLMRVNNPVPAGNDPAYCYRIGDVVDVRVDWPTFIEWIADPVEALAKFYQIRVTGVPDNELTNQALELLRGEVDDSDPDNLYTKLRMYYFDKTQLRPPSLETTLDATGKLTTTWAKFKSGITTR